MTKLETINAEDLQNRTYEPTPFLVDELIPEGLHILGRAEESASLGWLCGFAYASRRDRHSGILQQRREKRCISVSKIRSSVSRRDSLI